MHITLMTSTNIPCNHSDSLLAQQHYKSSEILKSSFHYLSKIRGIIKVRVKSKLYTLIQPYNHSIYLINFLFINLYILKCLNALHE